MLNTYSVSLLRHVHVEMSCKSSYFRSCRSGLVVDILFLGSSAVLSVQKYYIIIHVINGDVRDCDTVKPKRRPLLTVTYSSVSLVVEFSRGEYIVDSRVREYDFQSSAV